MPDPIKPVRVMIIDDSAVARQILTNNISTDPMIQVIGSATDPYDARDKIVKLKPDVVTLDIDMPRMDGLTFLRKLMKFYPIPVIIVSSLSQQGSQAAYDAMTSGAVDVVGKPSTTQQLKQLGSELQEKIKSAATAKLPKYLTTTPQRTEQPELQSPAIVQSTISHPATPGVFVAIGSSTGGTQALRHLLAQLPANFPPVVIVQHMPLSFTESFAESLDRLSPMTVLHAQHGDKLQTGTVLLAPGETHMVIHPVGNSYEVRLKNGPKINRHRPSVDILFKSVAQHAGSKALGVILTGMGDDGARGLLAMHQKGSRTIGESESSCVVYGMPREAHEMGAVEVQLPLDQIARRLAAWVNPPSRRSA
ncbi:chemotaxis response regulator protein-glutamate methylesterase [bacterium AH-315-I18]|nr:chemotaxis response regulator protein-glutamate methylesterase [Phycisphaeraceae bacterium]MBN4061185.1 chemotaxis response regulator protein-glutamate methylesterase [bacterium AH-315-I18]